MAAPKALICPFCGETQPAAPRCRACGGFLDALSRQATHNEMGPWFIRNPARPHQPGCSYETFVRLIDRGQITKNTIIRGPTTRQFWNAAKRVPGIAHLLGYCHNCGAQVDPADHGCHACGEPFGAYLDRNHLGLPEVRALPGDADLEEARAAAGPPAPGPPRMALSTSGRLSSFATDEELRAASGGPAAFAQPPSIPPPAATLGREHEGPAAPGESVFSATARPESFGGSPTGMGASPAAPSEWATSPAARAMQRKLARQDRTIRLLAIGVIALAAVAVIVSITSILTLARPPEDSARSQPPAESAAEPAANSATQGSAPAEDVEAAGDGAVTPPPPSVPGVDEPVELDAGMIQPAPLQPSGEETTSPESGNTADAGADPPAEPAPNPYDITYGQALHVIEQAADPSRPSDERIADYQLALKLLREIAAQAAPEQRPAELDERIAQVMRAIDRIEVEDYFGM